MPVDDQLLGRGVVLVVETDGGLLIILVVRSLPQDAVADGVPPDHRIQQIPDVAVLSHEGALQVWEADPPLRYPLLTTTNLFFGIFYSAYCFC